MKKTSLLLALSLILAGTVESNAQSEFISSDETTAYFNLGYSWRTEYSDYSLGGGLAPNHFLEVGVFASVLDRGSGRKSLIAEGIAVRPFVRVLETDKVSILLGLPLVLEHVAQTSGGRGSSSSADFGAAGLSLDIPISTGRVSRFDLSLVASRTDSLKNFFPTGRGVNALFVGVAQSIGVGERRLLVIGGGASFVEDVDDATLHVQLGYLFPFGRQPEKQP
jgi:hypothetical protein